MRDGKIRWGCIQPLTGGMYIGARNAIGHKAEWILSYPGLTDVKRTKTGDFGAVGNEYNILTWCQAHNELPPYKVFNKKPFDGNMSTDISLNDDPEWSTPSAEIDFSDIDIVVSVPVCSGLSQATIASEETKKERNCNMLWNAKYAMVVIKPTVYIFENAPALYSSKAGVDVRADIESLAHDYNYSVVYYKTDTRFHDNCQRRPRTFVLMFKNTVSDNAPVMQWERIEVKVKEYFDRLTGDESQQVPVRMGDDSRMILDFIKEHYGGSWRTTAHPWTLGNIINDNLWDEFYKYIDAYDVDKKVKDKMIHLCDHVQEKLAMDKNFYAQVPTFVREDADTITACMFKSIPYMIHHTEERLYTIREWLHVMGHPNDFEMYGDINANYAKIGQNVPARTAQFIINEAVRIVTNYDTVERTDSNVAFFDNTKQRMN